MLLLLVSLTLLVGLTTVVFVLRLQREIRAQLCELQTLTHYLGERQHYGNRGPVK